MGGLHMAQVLAEAGCLHPAENTGQSVFAKHSRLLLALGL